MASTFVCTIWKSRGKEQPLDIDVNAEEFISVKGYKALGNQLTDKKIKAISLKEALPYKESEEEAISEIEVEAEGIDTSSVVTPKNNDDDQITLEF